MPRTVHFKNGFLLFPEIRLFDDWLQNRFGVFPDIGFPDDRMFPERFVSGLGQESKTRGCNESSDFGGIEHLVVIIFPTYNLTRVTRWQEDYLIFGHLQR